MNLIETKQNKNPKSQETTKREEPKGKGVMRWMNCVVLLSSPFLLWFVYNEVERKHETNQRRKREKKANHVFLLLCVLSFN